jgi:hypothetical protein
MIDWREKLIATAVHFVATLLLAAIAAALIFFVWFPAPFQEMIGGTELFLLVVGCDLALGPLMSLVVYNSRKSRRELVTDYTVIGVIQVAALVYGVYVVAGTRPVYLAFNTDRYEVVTARDIADADLAAARDAQSTKNPRTGPRFIAVDVPVSESSDALSAALAGREEHQRPRFFVPLESKLEQIRQRAQPLSSLAAAKPQSAAAVEAALQGVAQPRERLAWLPIRHRKGFWTAIIDPATGKPVAYVDVDPY